jgi:hypothetical protein
VNIDGAHRSSALSLVTILANKLLRGDRDATPRFLPQSCRNFPKPGAPGTQDLFEDKAVLGFGAAAMLGGPLLQRFDNILRNVSNEKLCYLSSCVMANAKILPEP